MATALPDDISAARPATTRVVEIDGHASVLLPDHAPFAIGDEVVIRPLEDGMLIFPAGDAVDLTGIAGCAPSLRAWRKADRVRVRHRTRPGA